MKQDRERKENMDKVLCLLYHRINPMEDDIYHLTVSPKNFEEQVRFLKNNFPILRFEEDWTEGSGNGVVITFDDGYADNYKYALPILEKYQVPATIFVSTGYVDVGREYWWDEISRLLTAEIKYPSRFTLKDALYRYEWDTDSEEKRVDLLKSLHWLLKLDQDTARVDLFIEQLRNWSGLTADARETNLPVSLHQLKCLNNSAYITIGAHTVNHRSLGVRTKEEQKYEIGASLRFLEQRLGERISIFSYPFGSAVHFNEETLDVCSDYGITKAATTIKRLWDRGCGRYEIPRIEVGDYNRERFEQFIRECGVLEH